MKTLKKYPVAFGWVFLPLLFGTASIAGFFPKFMHYVFYLNFIYLLIGIAFMFVPFKRNHQNQHASFFSYIAAFIKVSILQLFLVFVLLNLYIVFIKLMPTALPATTTMRGLLQDQLSKLIRWGLFPWSAICLIGLVLAYYREKVDININLLETTAPIYGNLVTRAMGAGTELFLRQGLITCVAVILTAIGLSVYFYAVVLGAPQIPFSPNGYTVIIFLLFFTGISNRYWNWIIKKLWQRRLSTLQIFWLQTIFIILAVIIITPALHGIEADVHVNLEQRFLFPMPHLPFHYAWELFILSFWMALIIFIAPIFANIAKGKNLHIMWVFGLFWPFLFTCLFIAPSLQPIQHSIFTALDVPSVDLVINGIVTLVLTIYFWCNKSFEHLLLQSYLHQPYSCRMSSLTNTLTKEKRSRLPLKTLLKILRLVALFLLIYMFGTINLLSLVMFGLVSSCFIPFTSSGLGLLKTLWQEKKHDKIIINRR